MYYYPQDNRGYQQNYQQVDFDTLLKTSDIISELRSHAVETAVPHGRVEAAHEMHEESDAHFNPDVAGCCRKFVILLAPYAPDLCKLLWVRLK